MTVTSYVVTCYMCNEMNTTLYVTSVANLTTRKTATTTTTVAYALWANPADPVSNQGEKTVSFWVNMILIPLFTLLGVPGNMVNAVVFYRQGLRERINLCLFAHAIVDLVAVLDLFLPHIESQIRALFVPNIWFFAVNGNYLLGFVWASLFLSAVIASERCFCVVSPFHAKRLLKTSTMAAIIVVCSVVLVGGMAAIAGPKHTIIKYYDPKNPKYSYDVFSVTKYYLDNKDILDAFDIFVFATCLPGIFLLVIVISTSITITKLRSAAYQRKSMTNVNNNADESSKPTTTLSPKEVAVTRMLIGTSILFIVCLTPNFVFQIATFIVPDLSFSGKYYNTNLVMWNVISLLRVINCSINACVYYAVGSKFRQSLHDLCGCCCRRRREMKNTSEKPK